MTYCAINDIKQLISEQQLIELTDDTAVEINTTAVDSAIIYADTLINGYIRGSYTLPFDTTPGIIKNISAELALYKLYKKRFGDDMPDTRQSSYNENIKLLKDIQKGIIDLGIQDTQATIERKSTIFINKTDTDRVFSKDLMSRY